MEAGLVTCARCEARLPATVADAAGVLSCARCRGSFEAIYFPALFRSVERGRAGERLVDGAQAACYFHASRQAAVACEVCGRFLCELCDLPVGGHHTCPACLEAGKSAPAAVVAVGSARQQTTMLYDNVAVALAVLPLFAIYPTLLTAPAALFTVVRYWNRVESPVPRGRGRFVLAGVLALLQVAGWVALAVAIAIAVS